MKKIIALLLLSSCGYAPMDNTSKGSIIITSVKQANEPQFCDYYGRGNFNLVSSLCSLDFKFRDTCGKFQIGDTINLIKK